MKSSRPKVAIVRYDRTLPLVMSEADGADSFSFEEGGTMDITRGLLDGNIDAGETL